MDSFQRFQDDGYKNWIKTTLGLERLKNRLGNFLDNETESYHTILQNRVHVRAQCQNKCDFNAPGSKKPNLQKTKQVPDLCEVCEPWKNEIWENHTAKWGQVYWNNSKPYLWPTEKWEVAKVYMPRGNANHTSAGQFDISAFLNLMTFCKHFTFVKNSLLTQVTNVRNQVMHSADFRVKKADLETYLQRIRSLGRALEERAPDLSALGEEMDQIQNTDFSLILHGVEKQTGIQNECWRSEKEIQEERQVREFIRLEQQILKDKMECLAQRYEEDREDSLTKEELQGMRVFLQGNKDLEERLAPELERLRELEGAVEQHGQQINTLTGRVDVLEKSSHTHDPEFGTEVLMYKNHLYEEAARHKWGKPVFSEIREASGVRGRVEVKGQTFTGSRVCGSIKNAHQEVAKLALTQLANDTEEGGAASSSGTDQSESVSCTGSAFFGSVTVVLIADITSEAGLPGETEAVESAYQKLAPLFGLELAESDSSYKEVVLQHCKRQDVPPPEEASQSDCCTLKFTGPIIFHDSEGFSKLKLAYQQAAKMALKGLSGILGNKKVLGENYIGALKELLEAQGLDKPTYDFTMRAQGEGETGGVEEGERGEAEAAPMMLSAQPAESRVPPPSAMDTSVAMETQVTPNPVEERSTSANGGRFLSCVIVRLQKKLAPHEASNQEGAVQAAYSSLLQALSLDNTTTAGGERQCVQEFLRQAGCGAPEEVCEMVGERHRCTLGINGELTIHSPEGASKRQQAEQWAAKEALRRLEGVLGGGGSVAGGNYKGRLQELLVKDGGGPPTYTQIPTTASGQVTKDRAVIGSALPVDRTPTIRTVTMETAPEDSNPPPSKRSAVMEADGQMEEMGRHLVLLGLRPPGVLCEGVRVESWCEWSVRVSLDRFTFQNQTPFSSKIEATRSSYLSLGLAGEICQPEDIREATGKVKQYFIKHSFPLPKEVYVESEQKKFSCSLKDITCVFTYSREGPCEATVRQSACLKALSCLSPLIGCVTRVVEPTSPEEAELRLRTLLEGAGLTLSDSTLTRTQYRSSAQLKFSGYRLEMEGQQSKKDTRAQLSQRLLGVLGEEDEASSTGSSVRNALQEWFAQRRLELPVFEDTDGKFGTRITFSAPLLCSYSDWQISREEAKRRLVEELQRLVQYLSNN